MMDKIIKLHLPNKIEDKKLSSAFVIGNYEQKWLLGFNNWRKQLEVPAGKRELGERIEETAAREYLEETHQKITDLKLIRVVELENTFGDRRFRAIFTGKIEEMVPFYKNNSDEMDYTLLVFFNEINKRKMDVLDYQLLKLLREEKLI